MNANYQNYDMLMIREVFAFQGSFRGSIVLYIINVQGWKRGVGTLTPRDSQEP